MIKKWKHYMTQNSEFNWDYMNQGKVLKIELLKTNGSEKLYQKWEGTIHILR